MSRSTPPGEQVPALLLTGGPLQVAITTQQRQEAAIRVDRHIQDDPGNACLDSITMSPCGNERASSRRWVVVQASTFRGPEGLAETDRDSDALVGVWDSMDLAEG